MVGLCCTDTSGSFPLLSRWTPSLSPLCQCDFQQPVQWCQMPGWKQMTHQFFLHPETSCPFGYVLSVHYYFTWLIHISLEPAFVNSVFTASSFQFDPHFLLVDHTFSPFSQALLYLISCPSKTPYLTAASALLHPIFSFPSEIMDFLSSLLHARCLPALPHLSFQLSPSL